MRLFGKHRVRASFYHIGALTFLGFTALNFANIIDNRTAYILTSILFIIDYFAEMFDPHPDNMGTWYERYFHRIYKDDSE